ncbi:MDR family MFS transporter [Phytoactinopolyspora endophytica]|uniref:MDR family MFS transporter n=1 Tax=Phytoactinopolyspora endophytica TaxID=1642495 RepID=UPI00101CB2B2|nr:MDR family MFS transporter [Phytoactinopolyspora endophytica]
MLRTSGDRLDPALSRLIVVLLLGGMMGLLDGTMVAVGVDTLAVRFHASLSTVGWVATGYLLAVTAAIPLTAWATDRIGAKKLWLLGIGLFLFGSLASGAAWDVRSLIAFRVIQGLGAGVVDPLMLVLLARAAGPHRAGRVMGLMGIVLSLGPVLGPVIGGIILDGLSWRWMFFINVPIGVVAFLLSLRTVPADPSPSERPRTRLDVIGLALIAPGATALILALSQTAERAQFTHPAVLVPLGGGVALLAGYAAHARRVQDRPPLIDPRLFTHRGFVASVTVMAFVGAMMFSMLFTLPLYYQQTQGHGALTAGLLVAPYGVGAAVAMPIAGRLSDQVGARSLARGGTIVAAIGVLVFTQVDVATDERWLVVAALVVGLGSGFVGAPTMGSMYRTLPSSLVPQGSSVLYMLNQLGASVGVAVVAHLLELIGDDDPVRGFQGVFWWVTGVLVVVLAVASLLPGRPDGNVRRHRPPRSQAGKPL